MHKKAWSIAGFVLGIALAFWFLTASGCLSKVKSPLTGKEVPVEQAYDDYDIKAKQEAAKDAKEKAEAQAKAEAAIAEQKAEIARVEREAARRAAVAKREFEEKVSQANAILEDVTLASDTDLETALATLNKQTAAKVAAIRSEYEATSTARAEALAQAKADIQAVEMADAKKWAMISGVWETVAPVVSSIVPGGAAATGGINALMTLLAGGAGVVALRERNRRTKSETEREATADALAQAELARQEAAEKAKSLSTAVVKVVDSIEMMKELPEGKVVWDQIKTRVRDWQGPDTEKVVNAARTHLEPLEVV